jgi:hypothetical protein
VHVCDASQLSKTFQAGIMLMWMPFDGLLPVKGGVCILNVCGRVLWISCYNVVKLAHSGNGTICSDSMLQS